MLNDMGIRVVEIEEAEPDEEEQRAEAEEESEGGTIVELQRRAPAKVKRSELSERTRLHHQKRGFEMDNCQLKAG
jgi:hypothetical protein